jgi:hypothetical protein
MILILHRLKFEHMSPLPPRTNSHTRTHTNTHTRTHHTHSRTQHTLTLTHPLTRTPTNANTSHERSKGVPKDVLKLMHSKVIPNALRRFNKTVPNQILRRARCGPTILLNANNFP